MRSAHHWRLARQISHSTQSQMRAPAEAGTIKSSHQSDTSKTPQVS